MGDLFSLFHEDHSEFSVHSENYPGSLFCLKLKSTVLALLYYKTWPRLQEKGQKSPFLFLPD